MKRYVIVYVIMELQTETTMKCCYHVLGWLKSITLMIASADEDVGQQELSFTIGENDTITQEDSLSVSYKTKYAVTI